MGFEGLFERCDQGFEIHGSTGAPLSEKNNGWQKKLEEYLKKILRKQKKVDSECWFSSSLIWRKNRSFRELCPLDPCQGLGL